MDLRPYLDAHPELAEIARETVRIVDANESAIKLLGAADATVLSGLSVPDLLLTCRKALERVMVAHFEGQRTHSEAIKLQTFDGRQLDVLMSVTFPNPAEQLYVQLITLEDMTERLRTEAQLRQLQVEFERATRIATLGELTSSIAHEVNQPLAAITMNGETSLRWLSRDEPVLGKVAQLTERIVASARHASEIVQRIRGMAVRHTPDYLSICLTEVAEESLLFVRHDLDSKGIEVVTDFGSHMPRICGDRVQLRQVIINLLVNSIHALAQKPQGSGSIALTTGSDGDGGAFLEVRDNGPGIPSEILDRIFGGFFTTKDDGMGIGLSVCQTIITTHGGRISASNHPSGGAAFRFHLPAGNVPAQD